MRVAVMHADMATVSRVFGKVVFSNQLHILGKIVDPDHGSLSRRSVAGVMVVNRQHRVRHQDQVVPMEEEGRGEEAGRVEGAQVRGVEEPGALALLPPPHEDIVEPSAGRVLGGGGGGEKFYYVV